MVDPLERYAFLAELVALLVIVLFGLAERAHAARCRAVGVLAFGPGGRPRTWARLVPILRVLAAAALAWGLVTLWLLAPKVHKGDQQLPPDRHLVLVLDVSPSMRLVDAGPANDMSRTKRAAEVLGSLLRRVPIERYRTSVIAFYNGAKPVVEETKDLALVWNVLSDLPMHHAFQTGETKLSEGLALAATLMKPWNPKSTLLVVVTDGDSAPGEIPRLPPANSEALVVGVGDPRAGKFIDGRHSRQDVANLRQVAARLGGTYHDGNQKHLPTDLVNALAAGGRAAPLLQLSRREYAIAASTIGGAVLGLLPLLLHLVGSAWSPGRPTRTPHTRTLERTSA